MLRQREPEARPLDPRMHRVPRLAVFIEYRCPVFLRYTGPGIGYREFKAFWRGLQSYFDLAPVRGIFYRISQDIAYYLEYAFGIDLERYDRPGIVEFKKKYSGMQTAVLFPQQLFSAMA